MTVRQDVQTSNENRLSLQKKTLGTSRFSIDTNHRNVKTKHRNLKQIFILSLGALGESKAKAHIAIIILTLAAAVLSTSILFSYNAEAEKTVASQVLVGGGNVTYPFFGYNPQDVKIKAGGSVVWSVPPKAPLEAHTVTFVFNNKAMTDAEVPFAVPSSTQFVPLPPNANSKPNIVTDGKNGMNTVIVSNAMSFAPAIKDAAGNAKTFPAKANFTITGNEQYINSGLLFPKGAEHRIPGSSNTFTAKFQKTGTYGYICILHPWMAGIVVVQ
jgi:plastocyanin